MLSSRFLTHNAYTLQPSCLYSQFIFQNLWLAQVRLKAQAMSAVCHWQKNGWVKVFKCRDFKCLPSNVFLLSSTQLVCKQGQIRGYRKIRVWIFSLDWKQPRSWSYLQANVHWAAIVWLANYILNQLANGGFQGMLQLEGVHVIHRVDRKYSCFLWDCGL